MPYTTDSRDFDKLVDYVDNPVKILAEGDSWFAYPRRFLAFGKASNIVHVLGREDNYVIYSTASNGDEAVSMLSGEQKLSLSKRLKHTNFDVILFSAGGNDIVGKYDFDFFIKHRNSDPDWGNCIDLNRLDNKLNQVKSVYIELIERVRQYSLNRHAKIVTHTYDYAIPDETGYKLFDIVPMGDSWTYPYLKQKGFTNMEEQKEVVKFMLTRFKEMLLKLEATYPDILFVADTQGTLNKRHWRNEIHPTPEGFKKISQKIDLKLKEALSRSTTRTG